MYLIAAVTLGGTATLLWTILKVLIGLGLVIFVHELGHFLVAKACGVKCEKFYIGFDVPIKLGPIALPRTLGKAQWGETEYGIGIIPLGGYVKMLGQDDNPANAQREAERIRVKKESEAGFGSGDADRTEGGEQEYEVDPRSFPAKSVPQRMAIISAGVIMNLIFAVVFAAIAYRGGVSHEPCEIGGTSPGSPAWVNDLAIGSKILKIGETGVESEHLRFKWDLTQKIARSGVGSETQTLDFQLRTPDGRIEHVDLTPSDRLKKLGVTDFVKIGIWPVASTTLPKKHPVVPYKAAGQASPALLGGDRIIGVNGREFSTQRANEAGDLPADELEMALAEHLTEPLRLIVERGDDSSQAGPSTKTLEVTIPPNLMKRVGIQLRIGPLAAIRRGSPASLAGFKPGDRIRAIDGKPVGDPLLVPQQMRRWIGQDVEIEVERGSGEHHQIVPLTVQPEPRFRFTPNMGPGALVAVESIGIAYSVENTIVKVEPGSSADRQGLKAGDVLVAASFIVDKTDKETTKLLEPFIEGVQDEEIEFDDEQQNWPYVAGLLQHMPDSVQLKLTVRRGEKEIPTKLTATVSDQWFYVDRGLRLTTFERIHTAASWGEAWHLGLRETKEKLFDVFFILGKLVTLQLSPKNLGGPLMIAAVAGSEASQGIPRLLLFLTFLSANLAILNFLPIPALDGGHMLFLAAEAVTGKPVDERLQGTLTLIGVVALLGLMVLVFANDIERLFL